MAVSVPGFRLEGFTDEMFLQMCILSGVDYLDSPKGLGLKTANALMAWLKDGQRVIRLRLGLGLGLGLAQGRPACEQVRVRVRVRVRVSSRTASV